MALNNKNIFGEPLSVIDENKKNNKIFLFIFFQFPMAEVFEMPMDFSGDSPPEENQPPLYIYSIVDGTTSVIPRILIGCEIPCLSTTNQDVVTVAQTRTRQMFIQCQKIPETFVNNLQKIAQKVEHWTKNSPAIFTDEARASSLQDDLILLSWIYQTHALQKLPYITAEQKAQLAELHQNCQELWLSFSVRQDIAAATKPLSS